VLGEGIFGLLREPDAVYEKENAGDDARIEEAFDEGGRSSGLARPGRHLNAHLAASRVELPAKRVDTLFLVVAFDNVLVDRNGKRVLADLACRCSAFEVGLREEGLDRAGEGVALPFPEADFIAVREKDVGNAELRSIGLGLSFSLGRID
jgi:hypothetical protein